MWDKLSIQLLAYNLLPTFLRKPVLGALVEALVAPLRKLYDDWYAMRQEHLYQLEHTWQVCYMRGALNDDFDPSDRRIYIDGTGGSAAKTYIYTPGENQTKYLGKLWLYQSLEFAGGADFLVYVPKSIVANHGYEVRAMIDFYRLGGKRYLIIETLG